MRIVFVTFIIHMMFEASIVDDCNLQMHKQKQISFEKQITLLLKPCISNHSAIHKTSSLINRPYESQIFVVLNPFTGV